MMEDTSLTSIYGHPTEARLVSLANNFAHRKASVLQPLLASVIIPTYNRADVLADAVHSVIAQSYRPIELIIVDDGSSDGTAKVIGQIRDEHDQDNDLTLRYVRQDNAGAAAARNHGIKLCQGEFIQFLDSDDLLEPQKLAQQIAFFRSNPECDVVYGDWLMGADRETARQFTRSPEPDMLLGLLRGRWVPCFSYLWRRRSITAIGSWNESLKVNDDFDFAARAAAIGNRFHYEPGLSGFYRWHTAHRVSRQSVTIFAESNFKVFRHVVSILESNRQLTSDRRQALADCYWCHSRRCVNRNRQLFNTGMQELRSVCPNWQAHNWGDRIAINSLGESLTAQLMVGIAAMRGATRRIAKTMLVGQSRRRLNEFRNRIVLRRGTIQ